MSEYQDIKTKNIDTAADEAGAERVVISPRLQMIKSATLQVTMQRAELCGSVRLADDIADKVKETPLVRTGSELRVATAAELEAADITMPHVADEGPEHTIFSVFVHSDNETERDEILAAVQALAERVNVRGDLLVIDIRSHNLGKLAAIRGINYIELGSTVNAPQPVVEGESTDGPDKDERRVKHLAQQHRYGTGVLVGVIDVEGFDFGHPDFLTTEGEVTETRFLAIWDQAGTPTDRPTPWQRRGTAEIAADAFRPFDYGGEISAADMNRAIAASLAAKGVGHGIPATRLEPQSVMKPGSHGTHVASIAAGNRGVARSSKIAAVSLALGSDETDRRLSLYDSTRLADAVDYLFALGAELKMPVSINISLGTNGHAHDASSALSRWVDYSLATPGRSVCVAAGNAGQTDPQHDEDIGFIIGRVHAAGRIPATGLSAELGWNIVGGAIVDVSENELEIWYQAQDRISVSVRPPGGLWIGPVGPGERIRNERLASLTMLSIFNEAYHPANGANRISIYLSPFFSQANGGTVVGIQGGEWRIRLHGTEVRDGHFHAWIERDDPAHLGTNPGGSSTWRFPSFFSPGSYVDDGTIGSLACGQRVIAVANVDAANQVVNHTSSRGPTRDKRDKPDVGAPGTEVVAANGFNPSAPWVSMSGTSMASPWVAGLAALMLGMDNALTAAQIGAMLRRGATPLPGHEFAWRNDAGFGMAGDERTMEEVLEHRRRRSNP